MDLCYSKGGCGRGRNPTTSRLAMKRRQMGGGATTVKENIGQAGGVEAGSGGHAKGPLDTLPAGAERFPDKGLSASRFRSAALTAPFMAFFSLNSRKV